MSCWVVPTVAAELWGVSTGHVLEQVRAGTVRTKEEFGLVLVDVAVDASTPVVAPRRRTRTRRRRPRTYVPIVPDVTDAELTALHGTGASPAAAADAPADERALADDEVTGCAL